MFGLISEFTYLESKVSNDKRMVTELHARMLAANRSFYSLKKQFTSRNLSRRTKQGLYSSYWVPVLTYASETWKLSKSDETILTSLERKKLRWILGPVCVEGQWRIHYIEKLYEMYGDLTVVQRIKLARLSRGQQDCESEYQDTEERLKGRCRSGTAKCAKRAFLLTSKFCPNPCWFPNSVAAAVAGPSRGGRPGPTPWTRSSAAWCVASFWCSATCKSVSEEIKRCNRYVGKLYIRTSVAGRKLLVWCCWKGVVLEFSVNQCDA